MRQNFSGFLGATLLSGSISYHISTKHFSVIIPTTEWFLHRTTFSLTFATISAFIGVVLMTAGLRGSQVDEHVQKIGDSIFSFYASAAGSVFGWASAVSVAAVLADPGRYWPISTLLIFMVTIVALAPLIGLAATREAVDEFNNRWFRQKWREPVVRAFGLVLLAASIVFLLWDLGI
jgi:hypothetical protein